jgi:hypothetical protein
LLITPVSGRKPLAGSSVVTRHCSAAPESVTWSWLRFSSGRVAPAAMRSCAMTRSRSVTCSVTVCSTWMRGFISMKTWLPRSSRRNSTVPALTYPMASGERDGVGADPVAQLGVEVRGGRDLDHLLVAALHRAVALVEVDDVALGVGEDLHLDVARVDHRLLEEHGGVAERGLGLAHGRVDGVAQVLGPARPGACHARHRPRPP